MRNQWWWLWGKKCFVAKNSLYLNGVIVFPVSDLVSVEIKSNLHFYNILRANVEAYLGQIDIHNGDVNCLDLRIHKVIKYQCHDKQS